ncbi:lytic transglycosylase domain-containing protein [Nocardioides sp.]|uniref:aggregation-promoting factor C-terminal-like domain-containing protein n=1 Tax=Nocardioides sp. TaxID=35761 RepID=UPI00356B28A1
MSLVPTRSKYVPKHRDLPPTPVVVEAPKRALRSTLVFSSLAVAATGAVVSGGVLSASSEPGSPEISLSAAGMTTLSAEQLAERDESGVSRSEDRRAEADPVKEAALAQTDGPAITRTERLADGDPRTIARALLGDFGFSSDQFGCLDSLWTRESNWSTTADNPTSSAYGIPQALPGSKMASAGSDWATNPVTQITWGLGYIQDRYGSPCSAWGHSQSVGWY